MSATQDPTAKKAADKAPSLTSAQKVEGALKLSKEIGTAMLTTAVSSTGQLASRPMVPATLDDDIYSFYFNRESGKTDDIEANNQVNLSFLNPKTGDWVSISGKAVINTDSSKVKKHWSSALKAWFDDKGDGKHTGDENDPRVALIDVHPEEIRWFKTGSSVGAAIETTKAALSGDAAAVGHLVIVTAEDIQAHSKANSVN